MRLYLLGQKNLKVFNLPEKIEGSVSLTDVLDDNIDIQLIIEESNSSWILKNTEQLVVMENNQIIPSVVLKDYGYYFLNVVGTDKYLVLYSLPTKDFYTYNLSFSDLTKIRIGSQQDCEICYRDSFIQPIHAEINRNTSENGETTWTINSLNDGNRLYVNNQFVQNAVLQAGDIIFINGLRIIWMNKFLNINNPNQLLSLHLLSTYESSIDNTNYQNNSLDTSIHLYKESDYFSHTLRINNKTKEEEIVIEPSASLVTKEDLPFILSIGSSLTMAVSSLMSGYSVIYGLSTGTKTLVSSIPQIIMCVTMIFGCLIMPRFLSHYQKKQLKKKEKLRIEKYNAYLNEKKKQIEDSLKQQEQYLKDRNPSMMECYQMLVDFTKITNINFWCRRITDNDFLTLRLGIGNKESNLVVRAPEKHFTIEEEDSLTQEVYKITELSKTLTNVPITISLLENPITGIIINTDMKYAYINNIMLQLISMHSPVDLKIVILTNEDNKNKWNDFKYLPHLWSDDKQTRFFATNIDEINEVSTYLEEVYKSRRGANKQNSHDETAEPEDVEKKQSYKKYSPYYLIINDDYSLAKNSIIVDILLKTSINFGFSYLCIGDQIKKLPYKCTAFIEVLDKSGTIISGTDEEKDITKFNTEYALDVDMRKVSKKIANIPIMTKDKDSVLPSTLAFLEMLGVSKIEQLNILSRWKNNNPVVSLATTVGVHTSGEDFKLDLHEKFHGPHGLIAGMTGSGKSEFIITYILSMAINYHPYEVQFVLIDYKGGGLAGAFENKETGVKLPHLVGTITNLDTAEMNRTLVSIDSELKRRQQIFNDVRDRLGEGTIDIYKYQKLYREGQVDEPLAHLFIISDEFAELKSQQPEFMQQLISTARIGRSLGLHLILATQKPSGVVNDQIWSNSKFKVCLKVQDRSDSMEMLKRPEAASIKETGRFYLQVGYDDYFDIGQSGWSGAKYVPTDQIIKKVDDSIQFINDVGYSYKTIKDIVKEVSNDNLGEQITNVVKYIYELGQRENIHTKKLWLDSLPSELNLQSLKQKYQYKPTSYFINPVIGEFDSPATQEQHLLNLDLTHNGNTLIYGQTGSGKENLISTIIWSTMAEHTPNEVNMYIIDCGSETLKMFYSIPHVGEVATIEDSDLVYDIFEMLVKEMDNRKELFVDYAGSYLEYCNNSGQKLPLIVTFINNYEIFVENFSKLSEEVQNLYRDGSKYGIIFIISAIATNAVRSRMAQNFNHVICLQIPNEADYRSILGSPKGLYPAKVFGRGLIALDDTSYEFQTAIFAPKKDMTNVVKMAAKQLNEAYTQRAKKVPTIPNIVTLNLFDNLEYTLDKVPVGYSINTKKEAFYNFNIPYLPIVSKEIDKSRMDFLYSIVNLLSKISYVKIIDFVKVFDKNYDNVECYKDNFNQVIINVHNEILNNKNNGHDYYYVFLGIGFIRKILSQDSQNILNHLFENMPGILNAHLILVDTYDSYKNLQLEIWYQSAINPLYGIWLGGDAGNQLAINMPNLSMDDRKLNFLYQAFIVENGKHTLIKHVVLEEDEE